MSVQNQNDKDATERVVEVPSAGMGNLNVWQIDTNETGLVLTQDSRRILRNFRVILAIIAVGSWIPVFVPWDLGKMWIMVLVSAVGCTIFCVALAYGFSGHYGKWINRPILCEFVSAEQLVRLPRLEVEFPADSVLAIRVAQYELKGDSVGSNHRVQILIQNESNERLAFGVFNSLHYSDNMKVANTLAEAMGVEVIEHDFRQ